MKLRQARIAGLEWPNEVGAMTDDSLQKTAKTAATGRRRPIGIRRGVAIRQSEFAK
jgi:hypothetical protein